MTRTKVNSKGEDIETDDEKERKKQNKAFVQLEASCEEIEKCWKGMQKAKSSSEKQDAAKALVSQAKKVEHAAESFLELLT
jgi:hypothetical protein